MKTLSLVLVGFCDHQVVIWDYEKCLSLWVFKEGFNIPLPLKYVRCQYKDDYFLTASEDGSITIWNLHSNLMQIMRDYLDQKLQKQVKLPKFDVAPYHKILNVLRTPLLFIELWGNFVCTFEESQLFRMWVIEYQFK
jgi:WD40 repeat protein